tara:strand:+ start:5066 stop:5257 length:192 start_codon:yes stop_codon:yes gene_type:complete
MKKSFYKYLKSHECATIKVFLEGDRLILKNKFTGVRHIWYNSKDEIKLSRVDLMAYKKFESEN